MLLCDKYFQNGRFAICFDSRYVWGSVFDHGDFHRDSIFHGDAFSRGQRDILIVLIKMQHCDMLIITQELEKRLEIKNAQLSLTITN